MRFSKPEELKKRNLIVKLDGTAYAKDQDGKEILDKDGKPTIRGYYAEVQLDQSLYKPDKVRSGEVQVDANPYLASHEQSHPNGGTFVQHKEFYQKSQVDAMLAATKKTVEIDGKTVFGIQADITPVKGTDGKTTMIINTSQEMGPSKNPYFGKNVLDKQAAVTTAAKEARDAQRAAQKEAPEAQAEATAEVEAETPEVG